ncbi:hypothetical protein [Dokdonia donghaensis]|uniref:hypothetical protein n=1 Tax=Dokdonia donghaensis TaxID=326320 RepID=UPI0035C7E42C
MMKKYIYYAALSCLLAFTSCSVEETVPNNTLGNENGFQYNSVAYITDMVYVTPEEDVILTSNNLSDDGSANDVDAAVFKTTANSLIEKSYYVGGDLTNFVTVANGNLNQGEVTDGEFIIDEQIVSSGFFRIVSLDRNKKEIHIIFEFQRTDGELVAGSFDGNYALSTF